jgi:hypothetical protein
MLRCTKMSLQDSEADATALEFLPARVAPCPPAGSYASAMGSAGWAGWRRTRVGQRATRAIPHGPSFLTHSCRRSPSPLTRHSERSCAAGQPTASPPARQRGPSRERGIAEPSRRQEGSHRGESLGYGSLGYGPLGYGPRGGTGGRHSDGGGTSATTITGRLHARSGPYTGRPVRCAAPQTQQSNLL